MSKLSWVGPLFSVQGHLAERYALALRQIAKLECPLSEFNVDRMGWSPELAALLGEDYLGADALRYAIILSPDQSAAPPVRRRFSYEAALIEQVYLDARATLLSLVESEPVIVEMDNGVTFCRVAADVLGVTAVVAHVDTPRATLAQTRKLLDLGQGLGEKVRLLDERYIDDMLALVGQVGDPRKRTLPGALRLPVGSLWADVAGTTYVLRPPAGRLGFTLLIATRPGEFGAGVPVTPLEIDDPRVIDVLAQEGYLHFGNAQMLLGKRLGDLEIEALLAAGEAAPAADSLARRRQFASIPAAQTALPALYWELDAQQKRVLAGGGLNVAQLSVEARWALATPARDADVVGHLLARFVRYDHRLMAHHHRRIIDAEWHRYSEAKRRDLEATFPYMTQGFVPRS
jgi:hypothetical protein